VIALRQKTTNENGQAHRVSATNDRYWAKGNIAKGKYCPVRAGVADSQTEFNLADMPR
jgi:hypothetical protein